MQIHQQIIDQIAYITIVMFSQYIPQSNSILSPQRVIADKSAFTVFRQVFQTFYLHFCIQELHTSFQKVNSDFILESFKKTFSSS